MDDDDLMKRLEERGIDPDRHSESWSRCGRLLAALDSFGRAGSSVVVKVDGLRAGVDVYTVVVSGGQLGEHFFHQGRARSRVATSRCAFIPTVAHGERIGAMTQILILVLPRKVATPRFWPRVQGALRSSWANHGRAIRGRVQPWEPEIVSAPSLFIEIEDQDAAILDALVLVAPPPSADAFLSRSEVAEQRLLPFLTMITEAFAPLYLSLGFWSAFMKGSKPIPRLSVVHETRFVHDFLDIEPNQLLSDVRPMRGPDFVELEREIRAVLVGEGNPLTEAERNDITAFVEAGEYGLAVETLCDILEETGKLLPVDLAGRVRHIAATMGLEVTVRS